MRARLFVMLLALTPGAFAKTALLEHVPLQWKPTSQLRLGTMEMSQAPIQFETFQDVRDDKEAIGENREDDKPKSVTTTDDVGAFVSRHLRELFDRAGLKTVDSDGAVTIKGEVRQFFVRETTTYKSEVAVHLTLVSRGGKTLWTGNASGEASRFGRSYKLENYYEVLSDAIVNTVSSMLESAEFQKALSGQ
ncbi:MAG TPA: YajG family lipoprotein [Steroidobacteraceae bacterium]